MPQLPSGLELSLMTFHIMEPDRNWFRAPPRHFWCWVPDPEEKQPPFGPDDRWVGKPMTAPVPSCRKEMERFVRLGIGCADGKYYWRGEYLVDLPKYGCLSAADNAAWRAWLSLDKTKGFLDRAIRKCQTQSEVNREARGFAVIQGVGETASGEVVGSKVIDDPTRSPH